MEVEDTRADVMNVVFDIDLVTLTMFETKSSDTHWKLRGLELWAVFIIN